MEADSDRADVVHEVRLIGAGEHMQMSRSMRGGWRPGIEGAEQANGGGAIKLSISRARDRREAECQSSSRFAVNGRIAARELRLVRERRR